MIIDDTSSSVSEAQNKEPRRLLMPEDVCLLILLDFCEKGDIGGVHEHLKYYDLSASSYETVLTEVCSQGNIPALHALIKTCRNEWQKSCLITQALPKQFGVAIVHNQIATLKYLDKLYDSIIEPVNTNPPHFLSSIIKFSLSSIPASIKAASADLMNTSWSVLPLTPSTDMARYLLSQVSTTDKAQFIYSQLHNYAGAHANRQVISLEQKEVFKFWVQEFLSTPDISDKQKNAFLNVALFTAGLIASRESVDYLIFSPDLSLHANLSASFKDTFEDLNFLNTDQVKFKDTDLTYLTQYTKLLQNTYDTNNINSLFFAASLSLDDTFLAGILTDFKSQGLKTHISGITSILDRYTNYEKANKIIRVVLDNSSNTELNMDDCLDKLLLMNDLRIRAGDPKNNSTMQLLFSTSKIKNNLPIDFDNNSLFKFAFYSQNTELIEYLVLTHKILPVENKIKKLFSSFLNKKSLNYFIRQHMDVTSSDIQQFLSSYSDIQKEKLFLTQQIKTSKPVVNTKSIADKTTDTERAKKRLNKI